LSHFEQKATGYVVPVREPAEGSDETPEQLEEARKEQQAAIEAGASL
jgi:hypothetical protein